MENDSSETVINIYKTTYMKQGRKFSATDSRQLYNHFRV